MNANQFIQALAESADGESFREYKVYHPLVQRLFGDDENLPDYVVTSHEIDPYFRVKMQGVIQKYTDSSISSTINLAEDIDVETVADIYITAYKEGLKGVTVYREGSREGILQTDAQAAKAEEAISAPATPDQIAAAGFHPRQRPAVTTGITERINTGEGKIYVTINEDEHGICEVFSTIGKAGGNAAAQRLGALLAHDPAQGVDDVGLARAVRTDHAGDAGLELQRGRRRERLEPAQREALQVHRRPPIGRRVNGGWMDVTLVRRAAAIRTRGCSCDTIRASGSVGQDPGLRISGRRTRAGRRR